MLETGKGGFGVPISGPAFACLLMPTLCLCVCDLHYCVADGAALLAWRVEGDLLLGQAAGQLTLA